MLIPDPKKYCHSTHMRVLEESPLRVVIETPTYLDHIDGEDPLDVITFQRQDEDGLWSITNYKLGFPR